jgi:hypothetical protein
LETCVQATYCIVISVRARLVAAVLLALFGVGCRNVETHGPDAVNPVNLSPDRPVGARPKSSDATVEVCPISIDETGDIRAVVCGKIADGIVPVNYNLVESGTECPPPSSVESDTSPMNFGDSSKGIAQLSVEPASIEPDSSPGAGQHTNSPPDHQAAVGGFSSWCGQVLAATRDNAFRDYANYYRLCTLGQFMVILAPAAVFANSDYDADVGNWYQAHVRSAGTDRASNFIRPLGNGFYTIPFYVSAKFLGEYFEDQPGMALLGEFGDRTSRALMVGAPPFLALQYLAGGGRPSVYADESYWRPFRGSHGASGHAFMGAVPFLTLAGMTDDPLAKTIFYACSPWTGFTRINDNVHYVSQVWLGWWMALLATEAVYDTEKEKGPLTITPVVTPEMTGIGFTYQH